MSETLFVLVSSRGALATLAGVPSVERHVQAGRTLGMDVVVVFPPERQALGAEIRSLVDAAATCIAGDRLTDYFARPDQHEGTHALVVAAEWYLSLTALLAVRDATERRVFGRVCERGCISVPVARVTRDEASRVAARLGTTSAAAALAFLYEPEASSVDLEPRSEQRLSDNVSTAHAEDKLLENLFGPRSRLSLLRLRPTLAPLLARFFNYTELGPAGVSALKLAVGLGAALVLEGGTYANGVAGALLYFSARLIGAGGIVLARASLADSDIREKLDLAGDTVLHLALLWAVAGGAARGGEGLVLAAVATAGVLASTGVAYVFVLRESWNARRRDPSRPSAPESRSAASAGDEFVSRFVQRDGIAYALLFAALAGRLDLFLWGAAVASHLFYVFWLMARPRRGEDQLALGRPA